MTLDDLSQGTLPSLQDLHLRAVIGRLSMDSRHLPPRGWRGQKIDLVIPRIEQVLIGGERSAPSIRLEEHFQAEL